MNVRKTTIVNAVIAGLVLPLSTLSQELRPGRLSKEERAALVPGLTVTFESLAQQQATRDSRVSRLAALFVPAGNAPSPQLPAGPFRATWTGYVKLKLRSDYHFHFQGNGAAAIWLNDKEVLRARPGDLSLSEAAVASLVKGYNKIRLEYESPPTGDARMRLYWSSNEFFTEPLPPTILLTDIRNAELVRGRTVREGRVLVARHQCFKCHALPSAFDVAHPNAMPELRRDAPSLAEAGSRLEPSWVARWILNPQDLRNDTTMPRVFLAPDKDASLQKAADVATYLAGLKSESLDAETTSDELVREGEINFENFGCIACHRFTPPEAEDDFNRVSLHFAGAKYRSGALADFLIDSRKHYAWSRMPKFSLTEKEASTLAAFVRTKSEGKIEKPARQGDVEKGRQAFAQLGCANCHSTEQRQPLHKANRTSLFEANLDKGCIASGLGENSPDFSFTLLQRDAIATFLKTGGKSLLQSSPEEFVACQIKLLRCTACHSRDDEDSALPYVLEGEGSQGLRPDVIPHLTWAGEKLHVAWTSKLLGGKLNYRAREHFKTRMPAFPVRGAMLSLGLSVEHGFAPGEDQRPKHSDEISKVGEALAAMDTGLSCHRCHAIGDRQPQAPFDARSTNLTYADQRLRYEYYVRWMFDPQRVDPTTRMLKFAPDGKKTGLTKFYDGDARKQFEALWHYLETLGRKAPAQPSGD